jgi:hypothetical protein
MQVVNSGAARALRNKPLIGTIEAGMARMIRASRRRRANRPIVDLRHDLIIAVFAQ